MVDMIDTWKITNTRHDAHALGQHNSVFTVSNGYLGLKGHVAEDRDGYCPVTLLAGIYDELDMFSLIRPSDQPRPYLDETRFDTAGASPAVANLPNPLFVRLFVGNEELTLTRCDVVRFEQTLDLSTGVYGYELDVRDRHNRATRISMTRFASLTRVHQLHMRYTVTALDHTAPVRLLSGIDGEVHSNTTGQRQFAITERAATPGARCIMNVRTPARGHVVELAVQHTFVSDGAPEVRGVIEHGRVYTEYVFTPTQQPITLDRAVVLSCSEDERHGALIDAAEELSDAHATGYDEALAEQRRAWGRVWERGDVEIDGDDLAQQHLRFCLYHLFAAAPWHTDKLTVPVKLLTGEYYQGNTFYDTDLYITPAYLFTFPELARGALHARYLGLEAGRAIAGALGCRGAKFAWQAGPCGEECLGDWWKFTHTNIHINADVVYSLMQYHQATGDEVFMHERGVDVLVETARFYASRVTHDKTRQAYDLQNVTGPDEGHVGVASDFYTNYLARRNLSWAAHVLEALRGSSPETYAAVAERLALAPDETSTWWDIAGRLTLLFDAESNIFEQCAGFYALKPVPPRFERERAVWFEQVYPYQALNQPDVVMAHVLFRDEFPEDVRRANWEFYKDKSMNFSSMSHALNAIMAADMGDLERAYQEFLITAGADLDEDLTGRKDTYAGLHGTAAGGAWMAAVFGFGGVHLSDQGLRINPNLPPCWHGLRFKLVLRGVVCSVALNRDEVRVDVADGQQIDLPVMISGEKFTLRGGQTFCHAYRKQAD